MIKFALLFTCYVLAMAGIVAGAATDDKNNLRRGLADPKSIDCSTALCLREPIDKCVDEGCSEAYCTAFPIDRAAKKCCAKNIVCPPKCQGVDSSCSSLTCVDDACSTTHKSVADCEGTATCLLSPPL